MVTEVVDARDVGVVAEHADMLQIGTRNMANFGLLQAVGEAGKPVLLKRGMTATIEEWLMAAEYIAQRGNLDVVLCERGIRTFEPATRNTLDISAVPVVQATSHLPIIVDPSHAAGRKDLVVPLARAAIARRRRRRHRRRAPHPETALCDGPQALEGADLRELATAVRRLPELLGSRGRSRPDPLGITYNPPVVSTRGGRMEFCTGCGNRLGIGRFCTKLRPARRWRPARRDVAQAPPAPADEAPARRSPAAGVHPSSARRATRSSPTSSSPTRRPPPRRRGRRQPRRTARRPSRFLPRLPVAGPASPGSR